MKSIFKIFILFFFVFFSNFVLAQNCKPYSIPLDPIACGQGYTGVKFPLKVKTCPGGLITIGQSYNTENCRRVGETQDPNATNCALTPSDISCTSAPSPSGCPTGQRWVTTGSGIAHCVQNDFACPWSQSLQHDFLGNPYCVQNTCPSNQVLQPDGISCACSAGLVWDGASCTAACSPSSYTESASCSAGFTGTMSRTVTNTCPLGTPSVGAWNTSSCVSNAVSCPSDTSFSSGCGPGFSGLQVTTTSYSGASCTPYTYTDRSGCTAGSGSGSCPPSSSLMSSCGTGFSGQQVTTTSYSGASCTPSTDTDSSGCVPQGSGSNGGSGSGGQITCPASVVSNQSCTVGYSGSITVTTTYSGASCTPSTSTSDGCVKDPILCPPPKSELGSCAAGYIGNTIITTTYAGSSCTPTFDVNDSGCIFVPTPTQCIVFDAYLGSNPNEPDILDITMAPGTRTGTMCTGSTRNLAFYYECSASGSASRRTIIQMGCGLFN